MMTLLVRKTAGSAYSLTGGFLNHPFLITHQVENRMRQPMIGHRSERGAAQLPQNFESSLFMA
jgi:hypothetical protein